MNAIMTALAFAVALLTGVFLAVISAVCVICWYINTWIPRRNIRRIHK